MSPRFPQTPKRNCRASAPLAAFSFFGEHEAGSVEQQRLAVFLLLLLSDFRPQTSDLLLHSTFSSVPKPEVVERTFRVMLVRVVR